MKLQGIDDDLKELEAAQAQLRKVRDTMVSLLGAAFMAFGVLGMRLDLAVFDPMVTLVIYGILIFAGGVIALAGVAMGVVDLLRRRKADA